MDETTRIEEIKRITDAANHTHSIDLTTSGPIITPSNERFVPDEIRNPVLNIPREMETPDYSRMKINDLKSIDDIVFGHTPGSNAPMAPGQMTNIETAPKETLKPDPFEITQSDTPATRESKLKEIMENNATRENSPTFIPQSGGSTPTDLNEVDPTTVIPRYIPRAEELLEDDNDSFALLDAAVMRTNKETTELHQAILSKQYEEILDIESGHVPEYAKGKIKTSTVATTATEATDDDQPSTSMIYGDIERVSIFDEEPVKSEYTAKFNSETQPGEYMESPKLTSEPSVTKIENEVTAEEIKSTIPDPEFNVRTIDAPANDINIDDPDLDVLFGETASDSDDAAIAYANMSADDQRKAADKIVQNMKTVVASKIKHVDNVIDFSKFTIEKTPIDATAAMQLGNQKATVADWVLYTSGRPASMMALSGPDIITLDPRNSNRNSVNTFRDMYRVLYDHTVDANKPTFEQWMKLTLYGDLDHIYFNAFMATFHNSNYIQYICPKCNHVFLRDFKFNDMIKYIDDKVKARVMNILTKDTTTPALSYESELYQVSNTYAVTLKEPSIWNASIEMMSLSDTIRDKYYKIIDMLVYIDAFYIIDRNTNTLKPIDMHQDANDYVKSYGRRIKVCSDMLRSISVDEFSALNAKIMNMEKKHDDVTYFIPGCDCPKCKNHFDERVDGVDASSILFTRHQLGTLGNM